MVRLQPDDGHIIAQFPMDAMKVMDFAARRNTTTRVYGLTNLNIDLPLGRVRNASLKKLLLTTLAPGTMSIYDSTLVRSLSLYPKEIGLTTLTFKPQQSIVALPVADLPNDGESELVFLDNKLTTTPHLHSRIGRSSVSLTGDQHILIVRAKRNLLLDRDRLRRALSLAQGGRLLFRAGYCRRRLELNFVKAGSIRPLGIAFEALDQCSEFIEKYVAHERSVSGNELNKLIMAAEYVVDGAAGTAPLENKAISFFTALEILDGSRTLSHNTLTTTLGISRGAADLLIGVRNRLVHQGRLLGVAIEETRADLAAKGRMTALPFSVRSSEPHVVASSFRFWFLELLIATIARSVGVANPKLVYQKNFS